MCIAVTENMWTFAGTIISKFMLFAKINTNSELKVLAVLWYCLGESYRVGGKPFYWMKPYYNYYGNARGKLMFNDMYTHLFPIHA